MAIQKMKKLRLTVVRSQKDELLKQLVKLGCVQIEEPNALLTDPERGALLHCESGDVTTVRADYTTLNNALNILNKYAPVATPLLAAKPEIAQAEFLNQDSLEAELKTAKEIEELEVKVRSSLSDESRLRGVIESLTPWTSLDMPLETNGTKNTDVFIGAFPASVNFDEVREATCAAAPESELYLVSSDKEQQCAVLVSMKDNTDKALEATRAYGFAQASLGNIQGTAADNIKAAEAEIENGQAERQKYIETIVALASHREDLKLCADRVSVNADVEEAKGKLACTGETATLIGWIPEDDEKKFESCLAKYDCAWELEKPEEEEYSKVPVSLKNNAVTEPLNMCTNMYSLPAYGSIDPNPVMAFFFILFYGVMMADMGYGIIMIAFALLAIKKSKPRAGRKYFFGLMLECGISTFIMGILTGGFFSNLIPTLCEMTGKECGIGFMTHPLVDPLNNTTVVLIGGMLLGVLHLFTGMFANWYMKARDGHFMDGVWDEGTWMVLLIGLALWVGPGMVDGINISTTPGMVLAIIGCLMLLYGAGRNEKGLGKITAVFGAIYNGVTGWFGDILSYSRLMALMLAGSVLGQVFNQLASMPSQNGITVFSVIAFVLIFVAGHAINFGLNILGCFAHDFRLQCLEFFGKFYQDGGKPFHPLTINTKYVDVD